MTSEEAIRITRKGFKFAVVGCFIGVLASFSEEGPILIPILGYSFWGLFHGVQLSRPIVDFFYQFGPVHLETRSISNLFVESFFLNLLKFIAPLCLGFVIGISGGAIIRQSYLLFIVWNN